MHYVVTNITHTSDDHHRRGHRVREFRKGRVQIGPRNILEGRSASFSEDMYEAYKTRIEHYLAIGMIKVVKVGAPVDLVDPGVSVDQISEDVQGVSETPVEAQPLDEAPPPESAAVVELSESSGELALIPDEGASLDSLQAPKRRGRPPKEK